jgi:hypothetical protein
MVLVGASAPPTADSVGCSGQAVSTTVDGLKLDSMAAPGQGGTLDDPFDVTWDGPIRWSGQTVAPIQNGSWSVTLTPASGGLTAKVFALAVSSLAHGDVTNESAKTTTSGTSTLKDYVGTRLVTGKYIVDVDISGAKAKCTGSVVIEISGNPMSTPAFVLAVILLLLGGAAVVPLLMMLLGWGGKP